MLGAIFIGVDVTARGIRAQTARRRDSGLA
jgi:hypothetical protein